MATETATVITNNITAPPRPIESGIMELSLGRVLAISVTKYNGTKLNKVRKYLYTATYLYMYACLNNCKMSMHDTQTHQPIHMVFVVLITMKMIL